MPSPGGRTSARRHPSVKCTLKTKSVPRGHYAKGVLIAKQNQQELESVFRKRGLLNSVKGQTYNETLSGDPPDESSRSIVTKDDNANSGERFDVSSVSNKSDETKENKKLPPQVRPKPSAKSKSNEKKHAVSTASDPNRSVKQLRDQLSKLLSPAPNQESGVNLPQSRKSGIEQPENGTKEVSEDPKQSLSSSSSPRPNSRTVENDGAKTRPNSSDSTNLKDSGSASPSPRQKTANLAAMFENKLPPSPNMGQPNRVGSPSPKRVNPNQKPLVPNKPKSQSSKSVPSDSPKTVPSNDSSTSTPEVPTRPPSAKPAVPKKSIDSTKMAELRKSLSGSGGVLSIAKPTVPVKPPVALRPKFEKEQGLDSSKEIISKPDAGTSSIPCSPKPVSPETDSENLAENLASGTSTESKDLQESTLLESSNLSKSFSHLPIGSRLSNASVRSTNSEGYRGSDNFELSPDLWEAESFWSPQPFGTRLSNASSESGIPAELLQDTTNFSKASRFVALPLKLKHNSFDAEQDSNEYDDTPGNSYAEEENLYGDIWNCTSVNPCSPLSRDAEYAEVGPEDEDEEEWRDCDSDNVDSNDFLSPIRFQLPAAQIKARSLRRSILKTGSLPRGIRNRRPSYEEVCFPAEEDDSDADSWMTESDEEDYYEEIENPDDENVENDQNVENVDSEESKTISDPVAPPRRKSMEIKSHKLSLMGSQGSSEGELNGSRSSIDSKPEVRKSSISPYGSTASPMAAVMGQLQQALQSSAKRDSSQGDRISNLSNRSSSHSNLNANSNPSSPDLVKSNSDTSRMKEISRLSVPHLKSNLSASPSSVSTSSVSSTSSTSSSSSSSSTPVPTRPAPRPPTTRLSSRTSQNIILTNVHSDVDDPSPSSGYSSETDNKPVAKDNQSRDSIVTSSSETEARKAPDLPPSLPPRTKRPSKSTIEPPKSTPDEPPALPPPRVRWPKPVNPQNVSTSKEAMFPRSRSPEKIYQGQTGQGEGQTIPDSSTNVQNAEEFVNSFITVHGDRHEGFDEEPASESEDKPPSKESRGSSVDSEGGNYLTLLDAEVPIPAESEGRSPFVNEPLYQIYHCGVVARTVWESSKDTIFTDGEDPDSILDSSSLGEGEIQSVCGTLERMAKGQNASESELHATLQTLARGSQNFRTLWCEMPEVQKLGILESMTQKEKRFQESLFEIITSEASYLKSLSIFLSFFVDRPGIKGSTSVISETDRKELFSNIASIKEVSKRFMHDMETRWKKDPKLSMDLFNIISDYANGDFNAYVTYCANLVFQERKLRKLRETNERFQQLVVEFEARPECKSLPINTFLTLPMQRITRMPLLVDAVCQRTEPESPEYITAQKALIQLQKLVRTCNERARQIANIEQNTEIDRSLDFKKMKKMPIVSQSKSLVKKGKLTRIFREHKGFLGNKKKESLFLFLFNDLLIIAKKKNANPSNETRSYQVVDYASRNAVEGTVIDGTNFAKWLPNGVPSGCQNLFVLALVDNHEHRHAEFYFACESLSERTRWVEAVTPVSQLEDERIYEDWDCPQVQVIHRYVARQPDELTLEESDVINVTRKIADGWYEGERIRDGERGWFPGNHTVEIQSAHVRARNLKQRYRLLTLTEHYLLDTSGSKA